MRFGCRSTRWLNLVISKHGSQRELPEDHFPFGEALCPLPCWTAGSSGSDSLPSVLRFGVHVATSS